MYYHIVTDANHIVTYISHIPFNGAILNSWHTYSNYVGNRIPKVGDYFIPKIDQYTVKKEK